MTNWLRRLLQREREVKPMRAPDGGDIRTYHLRTGRNAAHDLLFSDCPDGERFPHSHHQCICGGDSGSLRTDIVCPKHDGEYTVPVPTSKMPGSL